VHTANESVGNPFQGRFFERQMPDMTGRAAQSAGADELEKRLRQQALLAEMGRRALADSSFDSLLTDAARLTALGMEVRYCKVLEFLPDEGRLLVRAGVGWHDGVVGHATVGADLDSPAGYALHTGKPVIANNLSTEERFRTPELLLEHGVERAINVIMLGDCRPFGVLEADSEAPGDFSEHDIDFLQSVANLLGIALEHRRAAQSLRHLNETLEQRVEAEVAEKRIVEDELRQAQKMEAVGRLTGGVAHDFNNLLMIVMGNLDLIGRAVGEDERLSDLVATAQKGALRGAQLTSQLLAFARRQTLRPQVRPMNELVQELEILAERMLGEAVEIQFELAPDAGTCDIDSAQFGSALLNLVINARDAMPKGGKVTVRTANTTLDARQASRFPGAKAGPYVSVEIADTGVGMAPDVLERAMEPFFTTKEVGKGTGLGLSQVYGFVQQSGGFLHIDSTPDEGTSICIYLPEAGDPARGTSQPDEPVRGAGTVLVVEDDEDVRRLVVVQLEDLGYAVISAASGPAALEILAAPETPKVDLLMTDLVMPGGMNGAELVREARLRLPDMRALLTSGYTAGQELASSKNEDALPLLSKPYLQADLARAIRDALANP
jgi:signal transduction histidine kinase/ActR/RegA family two-component response regulator